MGISLDVWNTIMIVSLAIAAFAAAAIGVSTYCVVRLTKAENLESQQELERYKSKVTIEIGNTNVAAERAKADAAKANEIAALAQLELAKIKMPRLVSSDGQTRIDNTLRHFAGTNFDVAMMDHDPEVSAFAWQVESMLRKAGWHQVDWKGAGDITFTRQGLPILGYVTLSGFILQMHTVSVAKFFAISQILQDAFRIEGLELKVEFGVGFGNENQDALHFVIGKKPY